MIFVLLKQVILFAMIITECFGYALKGIRINFISNKGLPVLYYNSKNIEQLSLEHIFPKCFIDKKHHNDLHNIYTANKLVNNIRSNYKFIDNKDDNFLLSNDKWIKIHGNNYIDKKNRLFIPKNADKGIISRSILYMCHKYNYSPKKVIDVDTLIDWCMEYKPSQFEKNHNIYVYNKQHSDNKFISNYDKKFKLEKLIDRTI